MTGYYINSELPTTIHAIINLVRSISHAGADDVGDTGGDAVGEGIGGV